MTSGEGLGSLIRFGVFEADLEAGELRKHGVKIKLQDQPFQVLAMLLQRSGQVVTREELRDSLWAEGTFVDFDHGLNKAINRLRDVLGDSAESPRFIETLPKRGYRFLASVEYSPPPGRAIEQTLFSDAAIDVRLPMEGALTEPAEVATQAVQPRRRWLPWVPAALLLICTLTVSVLHLREQPPDAPLLRSTILPPEKTSFASPPALSPDGGRLAFSAATANGSSRLWVRSLDALTAQPLDGTEGATYPFWAPDSRWLGFFADGKLKKIAAAGGAALTLCDAPEAFGGTWNREGTIVLAPALGPLQRVSATGGVSSPVTTLDTARNEVAHLWPWFLPDGRHFLYVARVSGIRPSGQGSSIRVGFLDSHGSDSRVVIDTQSNAVYAQGYLLFVRENKLMAQPFDPKRLVTLANTVLVADQVRTAGLFYRGVFSTSENGLLIYQTGARESRFQLAWLDRAGKLIVTLGEPGYLLNTVQLSPDRKTVAVALSDRATRNEDIWLYDVSTGLHTRFTFDSAAEHAPVWSPDGSTIFFVSNQRGQFDLYRKPSSGASGEELLYADGFSKTPSSTSPDGRFLLYGTTSGPKAEHDLWVLPLTGGRKPFVFAHAGFSIAWGEFSPDGHWIAYSSGESQRSEIYVAPFPGPGGKWQISTAGGILPRWRRDGQEIFYIAPDNRLMAAEVNTKDAAVVVRAVRPLFGPIPVTPGGHRYDVSADGQRFLVRTVPSQDASEPLTLVQNWAAGLRH